MAKWRKHEGAKGRKGESQGGGILLSFIATEVVLLLNKVKIRFISVTAGLNRRQEKILFPTFSSQILLLDKGKIIKDSSMVNNELREELNNYFRLTV